MASVQPLQLLRPYHSAKAGGRHSKTHRNRGQESARLLKMAIRRRLRGDHDDGQRRANAHAGERHVCPGQQSTIPHVYEAQRTSSGSSAKVESGLRKRLGSLVRKQHEI